MRPCNRCRQPVENNVLICEPCKRWIEQENESSGESEGQAESPLVDVSGGDLSIDHSYSILMGLFIVIMTALLALVGLAVHDWIGFLIGGGVGVVSGVLIFTVLIRF